MYQLPQNDPNAVPQPMYSQPGAGMPPGYGAPGFYPPPGYAVGQPQMTRPGTITAASIMWIIYGGLSLLGNLMTLGGGHVGGATFIGFGIAIAFLLGGIQLLSGKARGALGLGITSIILGALVLIACLALGSLVRGMHMATGLLAVIGLVFGGYLGVAGILGCVGNAKYQMWRQSTGRY